MKQTSDKWLEKKEFEGIKILDPDGWDRKNYEYSFYQEEITKDEFKQRLMVSTCQLSNEFFKKPKKHILDSTERDNIDAYEWDFRVWEIKVSPQSDALWVKPGELEQALQDNFDFINDPNDKALITFKILSKDDLPIKDFEGF